MIALISDCDSDVLTAQREQTISSVGTMCEIDPASRRFLVRADGQIPTLRATEPAGDRSGEECRSA